MKRLGSIYQAMLVMLMGVVVCGNTAAQEKKLWLDVGAKGAIGGNYLSTPDDAISGLVAPFYDGAGGIGGGGGLFCEGGGGPYH